MSVVETTGASTAATAESNRKRHTNTDSSLGSICGLLDRLYDGESTKRVCCYEEHTDSQTGNFMNCQTTIAATILGKNIIYLLKYIVIL